MIDGQVSPRDGNTTILSTIFKLKMIPSSLSEIVWFLKYHKLNWEHLKGEVTGTICTLLCTHYFAARFSQKYNDNNINKHDLGLPYYINEICLMQLNDC